MAVLCCRRERQAVTCPRRVRPPATRLWSRPPQSRRTIVPDVVENRRIKLNSGVVHHASSSTSVPMINHHIDTDHLQYTIVRNRSHRLRVERTNRHTLAQPLTRLTALTHSAPLGPNRSHIVFHSACRFDRRGATVGPVKVACRHACP